MILNEGSTVSVLLGGLGAWTAVGLVNTMCCLGVLIYTLEVNFSVKFVRYAL